MNIAFPIIAIGASAGGLEPLEIFFENADTKSGFAYVIIQRQANGTVFYFTIPKTTKYE
ncbi:hypothetical protein BH11BAC3_BH11BAC3_07210 [soil metagenome]